MMTDPQPPQQVARIAQQDEADLVARAVAGERAAFGILVERYAGVARRVARAVLGNTEDADDAAQDAMLSALVKLDQYDARRPFGPWLLRIVANAATDRRRRRSVRRVEPLDVGLTAGGPRPDTIAERRALNERLRLALAELPERRRMAVVLFDVEGYSHGEIALILGIPGHGPIGSVPRAAPPTGAARGLEGGGMKDPLPFDHRPDLALGDALRRALDPGEEGHAAFIARVLARAEQVRVLSWDAVLARWARAGVAAALVVALAAGYFVGRTAAVPTAVRPSV